MKKLASLVLAAAISVSAFAQIPKHEFTIDLFGGISQLSYKINPDFGENNGDIQYPLQLGGGLGFGYTFFVTPNFGIRTGVEGAVYRGAFSASKNPWAFYFSDGEYLNTLILYNSEMEKKLTMKETQTVFAAQIPLMAQFLFPMGATGTKHFYFAVGGRVLLNLAGKYNRSMDAPTLENPDNTGLAWGSRQISRYEEGFIVLDRTRTVNADNYISNNGYLADLTDTPTTWGDLIGKEDSNGTLPGLSNKGSFKPKMFNVMASGEFGIRWTLAPKVALYTGLYFDYGFLNVRPEDKIDFMKADLSNDDDWLRVADGSVLDKQFTNIKITATNGEGASGSLIVPKVNDHGKTPIAQKLSNLGGGLKLRLAFGVTPKPRDHSVVPADKPSKKDKKTKTEPEPVVEEVPEHIQKTMADLSNTMFDFDKYVIKDSAKAKLDDVVKWLQENPEIKVEIAGHTDNWGSDEYNQKLSENRAKAVYNYFIDKGVNKSRLQYVGYGEARPIATNATDEGRAQNRRVELTIIE